MRRSCTSTRAESGRAESSSERQVGTRRGRAAPDLHAFVGLDAEVLRFIETLPVHHVRNHVLAARPQRRTAGHQLLVPGPAAAGGLGASMWLRWCVTLPTNLRPLPTSLCTILCGMYSPPNRPRHCKSADVLPPSLFKNAHSSKRSKCSRTTVTAAAIHAAFVIGRGGGKILRKVSDHSPA